MGIVICYYMIHLFLLHFTASFILYEYLLGKFIFYFQ